MEKTICRILFDIINYHEKFLQNFFIHVLKATNLSPGEIKTAKVGMGEYYLDLFIETDRQIIPIEVKVDARDQNEQCHRYLQTARGYNKNLPARMYYLTKDKHAPSPESLNGEKTFDNDLNSIGNQTGVILVTYKNEILN